MTRDSRSDSASTARLSLHSFRLLSERSQVRLLPGARSESGASRGERTTSVAKPVAKPRTLLQCIGIKIGVNVSIAGLLIGGLMVAQIEAPKESIHRPGLSPVDQAALCETADAVRVGCE